MSTALDPQGHRDHREILSPVWSVRSVVTSLRLGVILGIFALSVALCPLRAQSADAPPRLDTQPRALAPTQKQTKGTGEVDLTAASANVNESGSPVKIRILRWSTEEERAPVVAALAPSAPVEAASRSAAQAAAGLPSGAGANPSAAAGDRGGAGQGGRGDAGAAGRGRGGAAAGRGARGGAGRGRRGDAGAAANPIAALTAAIDRAPTLGYLWTNEVTGYSIKYAFHVPLPDGGERIILATNRRLGGYSSAWTPVAAGSSGAEASAKAAATDYEFTLIEIRLDAKGSGEGKTSVTTKVIVDTEARTIALDNYAATPALLQAVKR